MTTNAMATIDSDIDSLNETKTLDKLIFN